MRRRFNKGERALIFWVGLFLLIVWTAAQMGAAR